MINFLMNLIESKWIGITLFTLAAITTLSLWPLERLPSIPGTDKTHHIIAYAFLMLPTALRKSNKWVLIGLLFIAYSGLIELLQPYVNRYGDWLDMAADATVVLVGLVLAEMCRYTLERFF